MISQSLLVPPLEVRNTLEDMTQQIYSAPTQGNRSCPLYPSTRPSPPHDPRVCSCELSLS
jgi:hypothetical protein